MCTKCSPYFQELTATYKSDVQKLLKNFTERLAAELNKVKLKLELEHRNEVQSIRSNYEVTITTLKEKQSDLETKLFAIENKGQQDIFNSFETITYINKETQVSQRETLLNDVVGNFSQVYIKSEPEAQFNKEISNDKMFASSSMVETNKYSIESSSHVHTFECIICKQLFKSLHQMQQHLTLFSMQRYLEDPNWLGNATHRFVCHENACTWQSKSLVQFKWHMRAHSEKPFTCVVCKKRFDVYLRAASLHEQICGTVRRFKCGESACVQEFRTRQTLNAHIKKFHPTDKHREFVCHKESCTKGYNTHSNLIRHLRKDHLDLTPYKCRMPNCEYAFATMRELNQHSKIHPTLPLHQNYICTAEGCTRKYSNNGSLQCHIQTFHLYRRRFRCMKPNCGNGFFIAKSLQLHEKTHLQIDMRDDFKCNVADCSDQFPTKNDLRSHKHAVHRKKQSFLCSQCGKTVTTLSHLRNHMRRHTGERQFICSHTNCGKSFITVSSLWNHMRIHNSTRPFACAVVGCKKTFLGRAQLQSHNNVHTGNKPFSCTYENCKISFKNSGALRRHTNVVHLHIKPFVCPFESCGKAFPHPHKIKEHLKKHAIDS